MKNESNNTNNISINDKTKGNVTKVSDDSREFRELNKEIFSVIQQEGNISGGSMNNNTNSSISGVNISDNTWVKKVSPDTSENFENKVKDLFSQSKVKKSKHTLIPNPRKVNEDDKDKKPSDKTEASTNENKSETNNPTKTPEESKTDSKKENDEIKTVNTSSNNTDEITDDIPTTVEKINQLHFQECKTNNLSKIDSHNYTKNSGNFIPKANFGMNSSSSINQQNSMMMMFPNYSEMGPHYYYNPFMYPENAFTYNKDQASLNNEGSGTAGNPPPQKKKKKFKDKFDQTLFTINLDQIILGRDIRTTIMIRHIPNKYTSQDLLEEIDVACKGKYDFFYLPIDAENNLNLGYSFINFVNPLHIIYFYHLFKARKWNHYKSHKECDLSFAKFQGKVELTAHLEKNSNKMDENKKLPLLFTVSNPPPQVDMPSKYFEYIKSCRPELLTSLNFK